MTKLFFLNKMNFKKSLMMKMFLMTLIFSTMITINSSSWLNAWMGMEINLMSFIPLMMNKSKMKISSSMMIYFIIQASASSMLLMLIIMTKIQFNFIKMNLINIMIQLSLLVKLGAAPLHWWMPKILINLNWMNCFILLTWQKIAPLFLLIMTNNNFMIYLMSMFSTYMGALLGMNQTSIKLILMYSSINHLGWMLMLINLNIKMLMIYFLIYMVTNYLICLMMNNFKFNYLNQLFKNNNQNMINKIMILSLFLSLSGLPPFLGFLPKILTLIIMINNKLIMESVLFIIMATISLSFYINPLISMFMIMKINNKWNNKNYMINLKMFNIIMINIMMMMIIIMPMMNNLA
nr:NADH dehydrogenase subunit 2 [Sinoscolia sp. 1 GYN-2023a]